MKKITVQILFLFFLGIASNAQEFKIAKLDSLFELLESNHKFMGTVALSANGATIYQKSVGYLDVENKLKSDEDTKYRVGSISKMFTAVLVFQAVQEGKLKLDDKLAKFFPSIQNAKDISIDHLLNHRSGIHNFTDDSDYTNWAASSKTEAQLVEIIQKGGSDFKPNSKAQYSNSNYVLLTFILEKVLKSSYQNLISQRICEPIGLINTYVGGQIDPSKSEAFSYKHKNTWQKEVETDMSVPRGAGAIVSTTTDLNKFIEALFAQKLVSAENLALMTKIVENYGRGIFQFPFNDKKAFGHTGGIDGFNSFLGHFPKENVTLSLISNGTNYDNNQIMIYILSAYFMGDFKMPSIKKGIESKAEDLEQYLGVYSSPQIPLKLTFTKDGNTLIGQATGQAAFDLENNGNHIFSYAAAGVILEFDPENNTVFLKQGGGVFKFKKE